MVVVAAARQRAQVLVAQVLDQLLEPGVGAEEVLADVAPSSVANFWNSPSTVVFILLSSTPSTSRASSSSQREPHMTLMTFQPAPRNTASSSWMILPLPRTGPSRRCRLALTTKTRLSSCSRPARLKAPSVSGSSHLAVAHEAPHPRAARIGDAAVVQVPVEMSLVNGVERPDPHRDRRELPELGHEPGVRVRREAAGAGRGALTAPCGSAPAGPRSGGPRGRPGHKSPERHGPGRRPGHPVWPSALPLKKWLNPTSYSDADEAKVARWPPMPSAMWLARTTMMAAFQRM